MAAFRSRYGEGPIHLLAVIASLALAGWAFVEVFGYPGPVSFAVFFAGAIVAHDLIAFPLYAGLWLIAGRALPQVPESGAAALNHVRVPLLLSLLAFIVWFPLILGLSRSEFELTTGLDYPPYLLRWLGLTATLFAGSGIVWAIRTRLQSTPENEESQGE